MCSMVVTLLTSQALMSSLKVALQLTPLKIFFMLVMPLTSQSLTGPFAFVPSQTACNAALSESLSVNETAAEP